MEKGVLTLVPQCWYSWQMLPGYVNTPYFSPILIRQVKPQKTGRGILVLDFFNAFYAEGVQNFSIELHVLKRTQSYLVTEIVQGCKSTDRAAIISNINFEWITSYCPHLVARYPIGNICRQNDDVQNYLNNIFGIAQR